MVKAAFHSNGLGKQKKCASGNRSEKMYVHKGAYSL